MENQTQPQSQPVKYGLIYGLLSSAILYILLKLDFDTAGLSSLLHFAVAAVCVLLAINLYKSTKANQLSIANALKIGLFIGLIGGVIYAIYVYINFTFLFPDFFTDKIATATEEIKAQNSEMPKEQMDMALKFVEIFANPIVASISGFIGALFETFIVALVIGLIKKSN